MTKGERNIEAVFFDYDDTLINSSATLKTAYREVARNILRYIRLRGYDEKESRVLRTMSRIEEEMERNIQLNRALWWPRVLERLNVELEVSPDVLRTWTLIFWKNYVKGKLYKDAIQTLEYLRNYSLGIITNTDGTPGIKRWRITKSNLASYFSVVVIAGEDESETKPSPEPFLLAASRIGFAPSKCLMVGDKPYADVRGAKQAGMRAALILRRRWDEHANADYVLRELSELRSIL